jgi:hypothetical protein
MTYVPPPNYTAGQTVAAADWNTYVRDNIKALASKCLLYLGSSISISAGLNAQANVANELYDSTDGMGDPTTNHRITIKQAGTYRVFVEVGGCSPSGASVQWFVKKNGTTTLMTRTVTATSECYLDWEFAFAVNDYVELWVQNGATAVTSIAQISRRPATVMAVLGAEWVSP